MNLANIFTEAAKGNIENPNKGGCLYMSYAFYKYLKTYESKEKFSIVQYAAPWDDTDNNIRFLNGEQVSPTSSFHFTWMYKRIEYDTYGPIDYDLFRCNKRVVLRSDNDDIMKDFFVGALNNVCQWNSTFCRITARRALLKCLNIDISDIIDTIEDEPNY